MKQATSSLADRLKRLAEYGHVWLAIDYEPATGIFEVTSEYPEGCDQDDLIQMAGKHLELLLAMIEDEVSQKEPVDVAYSLHKAVAGGRIISDRPEPRCPKCKIGVSIADKFCRHCGTKIPKQMKEAS